RTYVVEVDGTPDQQAIAMLEKGIEINVNGKKHNTKPAKVEVFTPKVEERNPPVNYKKHPLRTWLQISLTEGKNRQVRKMTAKVGHPTLRLIRVAVEDLDLSPLKSGEISQISEKVLYKKLNLLQSPVK
ncbi:MAG: pseudouridine synthase, partial [Ekhidna sp.]